MDERCRSAAEMRSIIDFVDSWVSNPVAAYSAAALDGLFSMTRERIAALPAKPKCAYCETEIGLRVKCDGGGYIAPEYTCEACFTGADDGPCFDDLPTASNGRTK